MKQFLLYACALLFLTTSIEAEDFYQSTQRLFSTRPRVENSVTNLTRTGPLGLSIDLIQPAFVMRIKSVEEGSPAAKTGSLKAGQIIESINGEKLADVDPRFQIAGWITQAEATDGKLVLQVADKVGGEAKEVVVKIPVLGAYSETWPLECPKSDRIVRDMAEYLKSPEGSKGFANIGMLYLLSTGDESDLDYVREWMGEFVERKDKGMPYPWHIGYGGLGFCEYYLRTGDERVLPFIQQMVDQAVQTESFGAWGSRAPIAQLTYGGGGGHLNASSVLCLAYLLLAKECGADVPDEVLLRVLSHFYRWVGKGNVSYGNGKPESGYVDNGKNGQLAFAMAAAASLTPEGESSVYAHARDVMAAFSFYSTGFMLHGHTGGGIGEIWRSNAMGLLYHSEPELYREFMDQRRWHYELSRRFDGSFGILGGERYDDVGWGVGFAMAYTMPRKTLRLTGAPRTKFSKPYQLPERPWGTAADDAFASREPAPLPDGSIPEFEKQTLADHGSLAIIARQSEPLSREEVERFLRHPDYTVRATHLSHVKRFGSGLIVDLLKSPDARSHHIAAKYLCNSELDQSYRTPEIFDLLISKLKEDEASWAAKIWILEALATFPADDIIANLDTVLPFMQHDEWWFQHSALMVATVVMTDERCFEPVLTAIGRLLESSYLYPIHGLTLWSSFPKRLAGAAPEVQQFAKEKFADAYRNYVPYKDPLDWVNKQVNPEITESIAKNIASLPGGYDTLFEVARQRDPQTPLPYAQMFVQADASEFSPELKKAVYRLMEDELIPNYIKTHAGQLRRDAASEPGRSNFIKMDGLVKLYENMEVDRYSWHDFGPRLDEMVWHYFTFDPKEKQPWDLSAESRYRDVTMPEGTEDWFKTDFDPQKAGWKTGHQPFGSFNGKLVVEASKCTDWCRHGLPMKTLWDKEVLLLDGDFKFPKFKPGHRYRLLIGGMSHVGGGEGYRIYVNGRLLQERERGVWRREGGRPVGTVIDKTFWSEFDGGEVNLSFIGFLNERAGDKKRHLSIWIQEMQVPEPVLELPDK